MDLVRNLSRVNSQNQDVEERIRFLEESFYQYSDDTEITFEQFQKIVKSKNPFFVERMFAIIDKDGSCTLSKEEFIGTLRNLAGNSVSEKLRIVFQVYDLDGDDFISFDEMRHVIECCMSENNLTFTVDQIHELTTVLFEDADSDNSGSINFKEFIAMFAKRPGLSENLAISMIKWFLPPPKDTSKSPMSNWLAKKLRWGYLVNNRISVLFFLAFIAVNFGLFVSRVFEYIDTNIYIVFARAAGQCLNFTCSFTLVLMLRKTITLLRSTVWISILPLDQHIYYHKLVGWFIVLYALLHTAMHICNFSLISKITSIPLFDWLFTADLGVGWVYGTACITGWILLGLLFLIVFTSLPYMRKGGHFEIFYFFHLLYVPFWIILIIHAPVFWIWFISPCIIFLIEKIWRIVSSFGCKGRTWIEQGVVLPSHVIHLVIKRPPNFTYAPGDFINVQIPHIARSEWHPFTISSAPEVNDVIWLHVRVVGQWTKVLYEYFDKEGQKKVPVRMQAKVSLPYTGVVHRQRSHSTTISNAEVERKPSASGVDMHLPSFRNSLNLNQESTNHVDVNLNKLTDRRLTRTLYRRSQSLGPREELDSTTSSTSRNESYPKAFQCQKIFLLPRPVECDQEGYCHRKGMFNRDVETSFIDTDGSDLSTSVLGYHDEKSVKAFLSGAIVQLSKPLRIRIDGPYGTPSSEIFHTEHAILVSTGIGVTPFASILQSIMIRYLKIKHKCPKCLHKFTGPVWSKSLTLRKVDFIWINRDQRCFEWFVNLLSELELTQAELKEAERFLDIHMYITSALDKSDMKAIGLQLALDLMHQKSNRDLITGLKTRTHPGRPKWNKLFEELASQNKGRVAVFYCGPSELGKTLHFYCIKHGFNFHKENF